MRADGCLLDYAASVERVHQTTIGYVLRNQCLLMMIVVQGARARASASRSGVRAARQRVSRQSNIRFDAPNEFV